MSFQVIGHMKTILVLIMGFSLFGGEGLSAQVVSGMIVSIVGMIWYGNASSKPGGKERLVGFSDFPGASAAKTQDFTALPVSEPNHKV